MLPVQETGILFLSYGLCYLISDIPSEYYE